MTVAIILYHSKNYYQLWVVESQVSSKVVSLLYGFDDMLGGIALSYFFMVSGFLLYKGINSFEDCLFKIKRRVFSLCVPFVLWNTIWFIYNIVYQCIYKRGAFNWTFVDIIKGYTIAPFAGPLWYVFAMLLLVPFSILFYRYKDKRLICASTLVIITAFSFGVFLHESSMLVNEIFSWCSRLVFYIPCYAFGAYVALSNSKIFYENRRPIRICSLVCAGLCILFLTLFAEYTSISWLIKKVVPVCLIIATPDSFGLKMNKWTITRYTFYYFAMHMPLIGIFDTILYHIAGYSTMRLFVAFGVRILFIIALLYICVGFANICKLILPNKLYKALSGGRS